MRLASFYRVSAAMIVGYQGDQRIGGFTLAQAEFDETAMNGMPRSAAATGLVDHVRVGRELA